MRKSDAADAEAAGGRADVLLDEEQFARRRLGRQQGDIVLSKHAGAEEAEQEAKLLGAQEAIRGTREPGAETDAAGASDEGLDALDQLGEGDDVRSCPAAARDDLVTLDNTRQWPAELRFEQRNGAIHGPRVVAFHGAQLGRAQGARSGGETGDR